MSYKFIKPLLLTVMCWFGYMCHAQNLHEGITIPTTSTSKTTPKTSGNTKPSRAPTFNHYTTFLNVGHGFIEIIVKRITTIKISVYNENGDCVYTNYTICYPDTSNNIDCGLKTGAYTLQAQDEEYEYIGVFNV